MFDVTGIPTPCYVIDESCLQRNLDILSTVQKQTGCRILMALKGFAMFSVFPLIRKYLSGVTASSLHEARLGYEEFGKKVHVYAPAYKDNEFDEIVRYSDHLIFNSFSQWQRFKPRLLSAKKEISCGIRINPEHSEVQTALYDPCAPHSRLGVTREKFHGANLQGISGLHFHTLCELNADALARTLDVFEDKFGEFVPRLKWVNFGGGHHITRPDYDINLLCEIIRSFRKRFGLEVYLEPGEAIALNAGILLASVLDLTNNGMDIAILDASAAAHTPDVLEMPYHPSIKGAGQPGEYAHNYRLGGLTCLAGDIFGDYSFPQPLQIGSRLIFTDMAHYTMVKNNTFNGINLPAIAVRDMHGKIRIVRQFGYTDYRNRLS